MLQTIKNESGFVGVAALCLIATATAFVGGAAYLDHSGKGIDFSLINPETADSVAAAGRENRMMAEDFISGYSDFQRENNRTIESLTSTYLVEYDQLRADLKQSEAAHRASIEGSNNLILFILVGIVGLLSWLFISAARHPRNISSGPRNISGTPEAYELANGSTLFIDSNGQRMICRPKDAVGLLRNQQGNIKLLLMAGTVLFFFFSIGIQLLAYQFFGLPALLAFSVLAVVALIVSMTALRRTKAQILRNQSGNADPALLSAILGCIGIALIVALIAGTNPTPTVTGSDNSAEIRMMAERLHADSMAQVDRMAGYLMQSQREHIASLMAYSDRGMGLLPIILIGALCGFMGIAAAAVLFFAWSRMNRKPTNADFHHVSGPQYREIKAYPVHRIDHQRVEQIPAERRDLLTHYRFDERGNTNIRLAAIVFLVAAMAIFAIKYIGGIDALTGSPAKSQPANVMVNDVSGVAIMFIRNPHGNPVQKYCVMYADGGAAEVNKGVADAAIRQLVGNGGNGVRQMGGVR